MAGELSITLEQRQEESAAKQKMREILRQNMDLCNKLSAARMRIIRLEDLLLALELDDEEDRLTASDAVKKQLRDELDKIPQARRRAFVESLPYKDRQALWNFQDRMHEKGEGKGEEAGEWWSLRKSEVRKVRPSIVLRFVDGIGGLEGSGFRAGKTYRRKV